MVAQQQLSQKPRAQALLHTEEPAPSHIHWYLLIHPEEETRYTVKALVILQRNGVASGTYATSGTVEPRFTDTP